jgi:hypothetical protein
MIELNMNARTRGRHFRGLVEVCAKYGVLPGSHTIPGSKIEMFGDAPFSAGEFTEIWPGELTEDEGDDEGISVAIKVVRYLDPAKAESLKRVRRSDLLSP